MKQINMIVVLTSFAALAACGGEAEKATDKAKAATPKAQEKAADQPETYRAAGTEPFWAVEVKSGSINYNILGENAKGAVPVDSEGKSDKGRRLTGKNGTRDLVIDIFTGKNCNDGMSERVYADEVNFRFGDTNYKGCGGEIISDPDAKS